MQRSVGLFSNFDSNAHTLLQSKKVPVVLLTVLHHLHLIDKEIRFLPELLPLVQSLLLQPHFLRLVHYKRRSVPPAHKKAIPRLFLPNVLMIQVTNLSVLKGQRNNNSPMI